MSKTMELVVQELQNTVGHLHTQIAILKAQATEALQAKDEEIAALKQSKEDKKDK